MIKKKRKDDQNTFTTTSIQCVYFELHFFTKHIIPDQNTFFPEII
jgi:hypothetical protein